VARVDLDTILGRPEILVQEIKNFVSNDSKSIQFRADLAGLLVVAMSASYEACVKETLMSFASRHHSQFGTFAQNHFHKLNSRVSLSDLYGYARTFDNAIHQRFGQIVDARRTKILNRIGKDITKSYSQILSWRHDFAHAGIRNTTVEEALMTHRLAKRVVHSFGDAFG